MSNQTTQNGKPTPQEIAACAYRIYEQEGRINGRDLEHWLRAEAQLVLARQQNQPKSTESIQPKAVAEDWRISQDLVKRKTSGARSARRAAQVGSQPAG